AERSGDALRRFPGRRWQMETLGRHRGHERRLDRRLAALVSHGLLWRQTVRAQGRQVFAAESARSRTHRKILPGTFRNLVAFYQSVHPGYPALFFHSRRDRKNSADCLSIWDLFWAHDLERFS